MTLARLVGTMCAILVLGTSACSAQMGLVRDDQASYWRALSATQAKDYDPKDRGTAASDNIRGNGARAGYMASHGGIVPNSETVIVDGSLLTRNQDYFLDSESGMLAFSMPVRTSQLIRVSYRYQPAKDRDKTGATSPTMALNFGPKSTVGLTLAQQAIAGNYDLLTYGLNMKTSLGEKSSMTNMMYISSARESGRVSLDLAGESAKPAPKPKTDNLFLHDSNLQTGKLSVKLNYQDVGKDFSGFSTLRQQNAAPADVLARLEKEKGIRRLGIATDYDVGKGMKTGMSWSNIGDATGEVTQQSFSFSDGKSKINAEFREISSGFKGLGLLTPAEQSAFAKETGMRRMNVSGDFALSPGLQLKTTYSGVRAEDSGFTKYGFSLAGKQFNVSANFQDIDEDFARINDLADADKKAMAAELGMRRYDLTTHFKPGNAITLDSYLYNAQHKTEDIFRKQMRNNIVIAPDNMPKFSILMDQVQTGVNGLETTTQQRRFVVEHKVGGVALSAMQDTVTTEASNGTDSSVQTRTFHFETDPKLATKLIGDWKSISRDGGKFEDTKTLKLSTKLANVFDLNSTGLMVRTETGLVDNRDISLSGKVMGSIALKSRFGQTMSDGAFAGRVRELSLLPDAAKDYGPFKQVKWSAAFAEVENSDKVQSQAKSGRVEAMVMQQKVTAEYSGAIAKDGTRSTVRSYALTGDPDPKKPVHYSFAYKQRDPGNGEPFLVRRYDLDWQINESMRFTYNYFTYNEKADGKIEPLGGQTLRLTMPFMDTLKLLAQLEQTEDFAQNTSKDSLSIGVTGKTCDQAAVEASFGQDKVATPNGESESHTYRFKYDHQMDADHFLTFSGKFTDWIGPHKTDANSDDVFVQLDFRTTFG